MLTKKGPAFAVIYLRSASREPVKQMGGRTKAVNKSVYGEVDTAREVWAVIISGTKLQKRIARVSASSREKGNSVKRDSSGTVDSESTSALVLRYNRGAVPETKKVGCKPSHGAIVNVRKRNIRSKN
jgi:hypothetical protein